MSGRATLVGGPTAGANHFGSMEPLGGGLSLFVPVGRTFNPANGKDWEGTGVAPDIIVEPEQALTVALVRAGLPAARAASLADQYRPNLPMTRPPAVGPRKALPPSCGFRRRLNNVPAAYELGADGGRLGVRQAKDGSLLLMAKLPRSVGRGTS
jgi:hypothetical protein